MWRAAVPVVCLLAGLGFGAAARDARGTELRSPGTVNLVGLVQNAERTNSTLSATLAALEQQVNAVNAQAGRSDADVAAAQAKVAPLLTPAGLSAVSGAGVVVVLNDAPPVDGVDPNQLVVHQSDLQSVVNALWAGGAQAVAVAGQRLVATSAVRCVGNTLLLNGQVFSPPYRIEAIGPADAIRRKLDSSPGVQLYQQAADYYGLTYDVLLSSNVTLAAYSGPPALSYAKSVGVPR